MPPFPNTLLLISLLTISLSTKLSTSTLDYTTLIFQACSKQPLQNPSQLSTLFSSLLQQSSKSNYFKTTLPSITGLYQCRGDLPSSDCYKCMTKLPSLTTQLCGQVSSARIQLLGCYIFYEVSGFTRIISGLQMLYKVCSATNVAGSGFEMKRDSALTLMENGINGNGNGFYSVNYEGVYVLGQCEGDLSSSDCSQCVKSAVQKGQVECGSSLSGQVYLNKCFIGYSYYPNGVPTTSFSSGGYSSRGGSTGNTGKTVAIIVGITAGVGFFIILVLFLRGLKKKDDDF